MQYKKTTLKSGLRILTVPLKNTQTATMIILVGVGSRFEKDKEAGISHFIEHMFFKGTEKRPNTLAISEELDSIGGEFNAFTGKDKTAYYAKADAKHLDKVLDVLSDMFLNSKFETVEINKERGTILQELSMYEDNPRRIVGDIFENLLYGDHRLGQEIVGNKQTISSVKREEFIAYMKKHYLASNTVVCVAGKFNEDELIQKVKEKFKQLNAGKKSGFEKIKELQNKPAIKVKHKKTDQTHFVLGARAFHHDHKDRFALNILATILGGNMSSRLFSEVREKRGLAYAVHSDADYYADCGYIATQVGVEHKNLKKTIEIIMQEYRKLTNELVSEKELQMAKDYIRGKAVMSFEASDDVAMFFGDQEISKNKIMSLAEIFAKIDAVTLNDLKRVAKAVFRTEKMNLAIIGPQKITKELENLLVI
jgi:predicted Zn-dependent peptidase